MPLHHKRADCRLCGSHKLKSVLRLEPTPPANAFVARDALDIAQPVFPLDLYFCESCGHVQLLDVVAPETLFENYVYVSGTSPVFVRHFQDYANAVISNYPPPEDGLVIDIGSNDGTLLGFFQNAGLKVLGIDPAKDIAAQATKAGIETIPKFFDKAVATDILKDHGRASVITANNVFAHADDLGGIVDDVVRLLTDDGVFIFEVSYLADVFEDVLFDTIYHEHLSYHSVEPLTKFFTAHGMTLNRVDRIDTHGGSIRCYVQKSGQDHAIDESVARCIEHEHRLGVHKAGELKEFARKIETMRTQLTKQLKEIKAAGKSIAGYGAPAKATTLMYHFGLDQSVIDFIADDSPLKQGLFSPGLHIPVLPSQAIYDQHPDYLLVLAWNFAESIIGNHQAFGQAGGKFIVPLPEVRII